MESDMNVSFSTVGTGVTRLNPEEVELQKLTDEETAKFKNNPLKTVIIPKEYKYVLDRGYFELRMTHSNLAFMIDKNLDNPEFLDSALFNRLEGRCIDARLNLWSIIYGVLLNCGIPDNAEISMEEYGRYYTATY